MPTELGMNVIIVRIYLTRNNKTLMKTTSGTPVINFLVYKNLVDNAGNRTRIPHEIPWVVRAEDW